jgi:hypothetical protein
VAELVVDEHMHRGVRVMRWVQQTPGPAPEGPSRQLH